MAEMGGGKPDHSWTDDRFLGERLKIRQPAKGFRAAIDSVLLPASVGLEKGARVFDAGLGAGVASLCLLARERRFRVEGLEIEPEMAALARANAAANGLDLKVTLGDLLAGAGSDGAAFDQVMTNPPFAEPGRGTPPPNALKARSHIAPAGGLKAWLEACGRRLRPDGYLTIIHRADRLDELIAGLADKYGDLRVFPIFPFAGAPAGRVIARARKGSRSPAALLAGLILHGKGERYTAAAERVLKGGEAIDLG